MSNLFIPESRSLSVAWAQVFLATMHTPELSPVVVTIEDITDGRAAERDDIRNALDDQLNELGEWSCHTVANTIFPENLWNPAEQEDAERLYERHDLIWPKIQREPANRRGQYFRRLTQYLPEGMRDGEKPVNQLKHIASTYRSGNHRRSALQAVTFDPTRDHTNSRQQGFPCLQEVAFIPEGSQLCVSGVYTMQYCFEKAYGNYLGLCRLGRFMAAQMGLTLQRMTCIAVIVKHGNHPKGKLRPLAERIEELVRA